MLDKHFPTNFLQLNAFFLICLMSRSCFRDVNKSPIMLHILMCVLNIFQLFIVDERVSMRKALFQLFHAEREKPRLWVLFKELNFQIFSELPCCLCSDSSRVHKFKCHTWKFSSFSAYTNKSEWSLEAWACVGDFTPILFISFSFVYTTSEKSFPSVLEKRKQNIENCFNLGTNGCCWSCAAVEHGVDVMEKEFKHRAKALPWLERRAASSDCLCT